MKKIFIALSLALVLVLPVASHAEEVNLTAEAHAALIADLQAKIQALILQLIAQLQEELAKQTQAVTSLSTQIDTQGTKIDAVVKNTSGSVGSVNIPDPIELNITDISEGGDTDPNTYVTFSGNFNSVSFKATSKTDSSKVYSQTFTKTGKGKLGILPAESEYTYEATAKKTDSSSVTKTGSFATGDERIIAKINSDSNGITSSVYFSGATSDYVTSRSSSGDLQSWVTTIKLQAHTNSQKSVKFSNKDSNTIVQDADIIEIIGVRGNFPTWNKVSELSFEIVDASAVLPNGKNIKVVY